MPDLGAEDFAAFFHAVTGDAPFLWQRRLAREVAEAGWPDALDLPTASGKTACLEIAVFTLALQAHRPIGERSAPRRVFFAVDRRVVVDQAYERAKTIASALGHALQDANANPVVRAVAERLSESAGPASSPLSYARLRGGVPRSRAWTRQPSQPAIIACTVDQLGSRLLFRSYGTNAHGASIDAGLTANDALIFLDEAHCARPFFETVSAIQDYRTWSERSIGLPFGLVVLSATPEAAIGSVQTSLTVFRMADAERNEESLRHRFQTSKHAALIVAKDARCPRDAGPKEERKEERDARSKLAQTIKDCALKFVTEFDKRRVAVMVNRVATAVEIRDALSKSRGAIPYDVVLITGRMRPLDRDDLLAAWQNRLQAGAPLNDDHPPVIVVATQSLEVGADFDFDAMVTEAASLDALRQRFGRLNRLGKTGAAPAAIVVGAYQEKDSASDPIYGSALAATWRWMTARAEAVPPMWVGSNVPGIVAFMDFSVEAQRAWDVEFEAADLLAPVPSAPVLMPSHIDRWVQTGPNPTPDPEPSFFLHGAERAAPEVNILWRCDLDHSAGDLRADDLLAALSLCPPSTLETLSVSLSWLRKWMKQESEIPLSEGDVEGRGHDDTAGETTQRRVVIWRGSKHSQVTCDSRALRPGDTVVLIDHSERKESANGAQGSFSALLRWNGGPEPTLDLGDRAQLEARDRPVLRLHPALIDLWPPAIVSDELRSALKRYVACPAEEIEGEVPFDMLRQLLDEMPSQEELPAQSKWLRRTLEALLGVVTPQEAPRVTVDVHPFGGLIVRGPRQKADQPAAVASLAEPTGEEDEADFRSNAPVPVRLVEHLEDVKRTAEELALRCGLPESLCADIALAARLHDLGKLDERFQGMLRGDGLTEPQQFDTALAKSAEFPASWQAYKHLARVAGLPEGFRHELVSVRLVESGPAVLAVARDPELVLHLIASHHGRCRPFAPAITDHEPVDVRCTFEGDMLRATSATGLERVGSGVAERFWLLVRRYGWWGLAYLETILRLADHRASESGQARVPIGAEIESTEVPV